jgi:hypothetical protein
VYDQPIGPGLCGKEFNLNSSPRASKALVLIFKLSLKVLDVVPFVAPDSCTLLPTKHPLKLSLKAVQVLISDVLMVLDHPLQPSRPGPVGVVHNGVVNLLASGILTIWHKHVYTVYRHVYGASVAC